MPIKRHCPCDPKNSEAGSHRGQELPQGFCGTCERCGQPGHTSHYEMQTSYRPLTSKQLAELKGYVAWSTSIMGMGLFALVGICLGSILRDVVERINHRANSLWWIVPLVFVMTGILAWAKRREGGRPFRQQVKADIHRGEAAVHRIDVVDVIEVEELEDEGPGFFVKTTDGQVLFFSGQYLYRYQKRKFPWKSFEIVEAPASKVFFFLKPLDAPFKPSYVRKPLSWEEAKRFGFKDYQVVDIDFEVLKEKGVQGAATATKSDLSTNG